MFNHGRMWIPEDVLNLCELIEEGAGIKQIAFELGRSVSACKSRMSMARFSVRMDSHHTQIVSVINKISDKSRRKK